MEETPVELENYSWEPEMVPAEEQHESSVHFQDHGKLQRFEQYDMRPFLSFVNAQSCQEDTAEKVMSQFSEWLLNCQTEDFLFTFESKPDLKHMASGKCPYFHTGMTCLELQEYTRRMEQQYKTKLEINEFLRKRLRLVQRLLKVYKNAKRGIEEEYQKNLSKNDPYCDVKKRLATKRIVDMMIKQFALEYLYLKSIQIKKEIDLIRCILIDTDRLRHLKNIYKYTLKTAEKLRCLLETECGESVGKFERYFEENTLKDMARMYLTEIESTKVSKIYLSSEDWTNEQNWECTSSSEGGVPEQETLSELVEKSLLRDETWKEPESMSEDLSVSLDDATVSDRLDEALIRNTEGSKTVQEEQEKSFGKIPDKLLGLGEESFRVVPPEESHNVLDEIRKEILKQDYSLSGESSFEVPAEDEENDEIAAERAAQRAAQLEKTRAEAEMTEEFKRELWLVESFHYYTTQIRPELFGVFKLVHTKCVYDDLLAKQDKEEDASTTEVESSIGSDLNKCLVYLNRVRADDEDKAEENESLESVVSSKGSDVRTSVKVQSTRTGGSSFSKLTPGLENSVGSIELKENSEDKYLEYESTKQSQIPLETDVNYSDYPEEGYSEKVESPESKVTESVPGETIAESETNAELQDLSEGSPSESVKFPSKSVSEKLVETSSVSEPSVMIDRSRGLSLPSFSGSLPDPFKTYKKCLRDRELGIDEETPDSETIYSARQDRPVEQSTANEPLLSAARETKSDMNMAKLLKGSLDSTSSSESASSSSESSDSSTSSEIFKREPEEQNSKGIKCFPTLFDVIRYFTKAVKGQPSSSTLVAEEEESNVEKEEKQVDLKELINIKWTIPSEGNKPKEQLECEFNTAEFLEKLRKSNTQYMRNHPEMSAVASLILREVSMKRPENEFIKFMRDAVFNKHFARQISSYLAVNNKCYRRRNSIDLRQCVHGLNNQSPNVFKFDKSSTEYWREWGVDYQRMSEKYGPNASWDPGTPREKEKDTKKDRDPWDLLGTQEQLEESSRKHRDICGLPARNLTKHLIKDADRDLKKERTRVTALANEVDWGLPPDLRSSCQQAYLKRYILDRKKH